MRLAAQLHCGKWHARADMAILHDVHTEGFQPVFLDPAMRLAGNHGDGRPVQIAGQRPVAAFHPAFRQYAIFIPPELHGEGAIAQPLGIPVQISSRLIALAIPAAGQVLRITGPN